MDTMLLHFVQHSHAYTALVALLMGHAGALRAFLALVLRFVPKSVLDAEIARLAAKGKALVDQAAAQNQVPPAAVAPVPAAPAPAAAPQPLVSPKP